MYAHLFKEGCLVAKKDHHKEKHSDALNIPNLEVIGLLRSFRSKGYVKETFNWRWYYWYLTADGIEYLRKYLNIPAEVVPDTLKKPAVSERPQRPVESDRRGGRRGRFGDKPGFGRGGRMGRGDGYRRE